MNELSIKEWALRNSIRMPEHVQINQEAVQKVLDPYQGNAERIKRDFDLLIDSIHDAAYQTYLQYQAEYGKKALRHYFVELLKNKNILNSDGIADTVASRFSELDKFYLSLSQGRKSRAGSTFEFIHNSLFKSLGYPFTEQPILNGRPDFVLPSKAHYDRQPTDCLVFTAKRTVRERWGQVTVEGARTSIFFLATIDRKVSATKLHEMHEKRVFVVCPKELKIGKYPDFDNVMSYATFFNDYLDPAMTRWERNRVI